jgi:hypothetical protein
MAAADQQVDFGSFSNQYRGVETRNKKNQSTPFDFDFTRTVLPD